MMPISITVERWRKKLAGLLEEMFQDLSHEDAERIVLEQVKILGAKLSDPICLRRSHLRVLQGQGMARKRRRPGLALPFLTLLKGGHGDQ